MEEIKFNFTIRATKKLDYNQVQQLAKNIVLSLRDDEKNTKRLTGDMDVELKSFNLENKKMEVYTLSFR